MISVNQITKRYGSNTVVDHVNLEIPAGKLSAFIGSNGAGKSTLLSIISRILGKCEGTVCIDNKDLSAWKSHDLATKLSILKQSNHMNIRLRVHELVEFGRFPYTKGKLTAEDHEKVAEAMHYLQLEDLKDRYLDELSGGQRQMAYIAMIIAQDTEYILLDEPLNNLDMHHSVTIMKTLRRMVDELGKTIVVVIHDINFVASYADYIIAMKDGKVITSGSTKDILHSALLKEVYGMDIDIHHINGKNICLYYGS